MQEEWMNGKKADQKEVYFMPMDVEKWEPDT